VAGKETRLTPTEIHLLQELVLNVGKVLTHSYLLNKVWGPEYRDERQYLHVFVGCLRTKLRLEREGPGAIDSVAGVGYRFNV
jgi:two-component system KDP operon response regulator KdpE